MLCCLADYIFFSFKDEKRFIFLGNMNAKDAKEKKNAWRQLKFVI